MAKLKLSFVCQECSYESYKWLGKCPECNEWNSFEEVTFTKTENRNLDKISDLASTRPKLIYEIEKTSLERFITGIKEFDRVLGGGVAKGSLTLLGGEPGIGKSTLLMEVCSRISTSDVKNKILYVSGEESEEHIAARSKRLGVNADNFLLYNETSWQKIQENLKKIKPKLLIIDSIQTTVSNEIHSAAGTISQIREVTYELMNYIKTCGMTCFIVGHVTKEGAIAGPKLLEHMVDTVIYFEGDKFGQYRVLRGIKNRFGSTNEVGIFEMNDNGLKEVINPSQYFLDPATSSNLGQSLTCILEGTRPIFVAIQALVIENKFGNGRRTTQGLDNNRLSLLIAVIDKYFKIPLSFNDIYLNVVNGIKLISRESDLSIIASLLSSYYDLSLPEDVIFIGEVGLTGEVRSVPNIQMLLREMSYLNYKKIITSKKVENDYADKFDIEIVGVNTASELKKIFFE